MTDRKKCYSLVCEICGKPFFYPVPNRKTCGPECAKTYASRRRTAWEIKSGHRDRLKAERKAKKPEAPRRSESKLAPGGTPGNLTAEYWQKWQKRELKYAESMGRRSVSAVNGIDVNDPDFIDKVLITIEERGAVMIVSALERTKDIED